MLKKYYATAGLTLFFISTGISREVILFEDFEDATITYTSSISDDLTDISNLDYYGRIAADTAPTVPAALSYTNLQGSGYYGAQDINAANSDTVNSITLNWTGIDISSYIDLELSWFVAEDDATDGNEDWDSTSSVKLEFQLDGGGFSNVFAIEAESVAGDETNQMPRIDTDFDGIGDGNEITDSFTIYSSSIGNAAALDIRLTFESLNAADEDIAFDSLQLTGTAPAALPEPNFISIIVIAGLWGMIRRRRTAKER